MKHIEDYSDDRLKAWCIHCGQSISTLDINHDHAPSKSLLRVPYPDNLPVIEICKECNTSFSLDEEYLIVFLETVLAGSTDNEFLHNPKIARALKRNLSLKARINESKVRETIGEEQRIFWRPETERVNRVILKNARGHAFHEYGEPMLDEPEYVSSLPLECMGQDQKKEFETIECQLFPEVGSRMMDRVVTGQDLVDGWVIVQDSIYRYSVIQEGEGIRVRSVLFEYLATDVFWGQ